jgi:hypothetical protein
MSWSILTVGFSHSPGELRNQRPKAAITVIKTAIMKDLYVFTKKTSYGVREYRADL